MLKGPHSKRRSASHIAMHEVAKALNSESPLLFLSAKAGILRRLTGWKICANQENTSTCRIELISRDERIAKLSGTGISLEQDLSAGFDKLINGAATRTGPRHCVT